MPIAFDTHDSAELMKGEPVFEGPLCVVLLVEDRVSRRDRYFLHIFLNLNGMRKDGKEHTKVLETHLPEMLGPRLDAFIPMANPQPHANI